MHRLLFFLLLMSWTTSVAMGQESNSNAYTLEKSPFFRRMLFSKPTGYENSYAYVDLGLSVKWAICNIGAERINDYGDLYAWGETSTKSVYDESTYKLYGTRRELMTMKYVLMDGFDALKLRPKYDVAHVLWGGNWRMPTKDDFDELIEKCTRAWVVINGKKGLKVTGPNGKSIFFPFFNFGSFDDNGEPLKMVVYWSSTLFDDTSAETSNLVEDDVLPLAWMEEFHTGLPVRPVCP